MQSPIVKLAFVVVMIHMSFGCSWHHGLGAHACTNLVSATVCQHHAGFESHPCGGEGHQHHDPGNSDSPDTDLPSAPVDSQSLVIISVESPSDSHLGCQDDHCDLIQFVKYTYTSPDFAVEYLGGAASIVIADRLLPAGISLDPFSDCSHTVTAVRAHLLFGVLTI